MNIKTIVASSALAALLIAAVPLASAGAGADGDLSRTFPTAVLVRANFPAPGAGIVGGTPATVCPVSLLTAQVPATVGIYYETLRIAPLVNQNLATTPPIGPISIGACPIPGSNPGTYAVQATAGTFDSGVYVSQSTLVATQDTFVDYYPTSARWNTMECASPAWTQPVAGDAKGLLSSLGVGGVMSTAISCSAGTVLDFSSTIDTFDLGEFGTSISSYPEVSAMASANGWVASCTDSDGVTLDNSGPIPVAGTYSHVESSHDWFLAASASVTAGMLTAHFGVGTGHPLQGLYDLHGGNDCPFAMI